MKKIIKQQPILQPEIKEVKDAVIRLVNGSEITITHRMKDNEEDCVRGKRANINPWWYAFESHGISDEELDEILDQYIVKADENDRVQ